MRFLHLSLIATLFLNSYLTASENISIESNADGTKRRAVTRSSARNGAPRSPLVLLSSVSTNSNNNFAEADNSRYRHNQPILGQPAAPVVMTPEMARLHTEHNQDWSKTKLPTVHRLAKDIIIDFLLYGNPDISVDDRYQQILGAHNLFLTCKHWAEFTIDCQSEAWARNPVTPRWIPMWQPFTLFNDDINRVMLIRTAMYRLLAEITGFDQATAKDKTARNTQVSSLYTSYSDEQIGRMLANFKVQKNNGERAYYLNDYHNSERTKGNKYWIQVRKIQDLLADPRRQPPSDLVIKENLKFIPHNLMNLGRTLRKLDLSNNLLSEIPKSIEQLSALERLDLSNNPSLSRLPSSLSRMTSLRHIDLSNTGNWQNIELPTLVQSLVMSNVNFCNLETLRADGVTLLIARQDCFPVAPTRMPELFNKLPSLTRLQRLELGSYTIPTLTNDLARCTTLRSLDLRLGPNNDRHTSEPPKAEALPTSLVNLDLAGNLTLDHIASIKGLKNLQILNLSSTSKNNTPLNPDITTFPDLRVLAISSPIFAPALFESCTNLEFLIFDGEAIKMAQEGLENFPLFFQHYTEFRYINFYNSNSLILIAIISHRPFPWRNSLSKKPLSQILPLHHLKGTKVQVRARNGQNWDESYTEKGEIPQDFLDNLGSALKPEAFSPMN